METAIQKRLKQTPEQYDDMVLTMWLRWCGEKTDNQTGLQKAMTTRPLFNWWRAELSKYEEIYLADTAPYIEVMDAKMAKILYADTIIPIFDYFPGPLMPKKTKTNPVKP